MSAGFVQALWRFPVLGMAGETLRSTQIDVRGVAGDRQHYAGGPEGRSAVAGINVQLALPLPKAGGWAGTELIFRDGVRLKLVASRADGPGIEARVVEAGRIVLGEPVVLG